MPRNQLIQLRAGTAAAWTSANPVLALNEPGLETDTGKEKRGDGSTAWSSLPYTTDASRLPTAVVSGAALGATSEQTTNKGIANGYASLDGAGKLPASQLTVDAMEYKGSWNASTNTPALANGSGSPGDFYIVSTAGSQNLGSGSMTFAAGDHVILNPSLVYEDIPVGATGGVASFDGRTGTVTPASGDYTVSQITGAAPAASPTLTGTVTIPTPTAGDNSTKAASTAFVAAAVAAAGINGGTP